MLLQHYLILDGSQIDNLIRVIYKLQKIVEIDILFLNTRFAELQEVSPVLVKIEPNGLLFQRFQTDWQENAGIHFLARGDIYTLGNHLRSSLQAKINQQPTLFRFYDPRILQLWFETITQDQRSQFMGPITNLYLPIINDKQSVEYKNDTHMICITPEIIWINLSDQQLEYLVLAKKNEIRKQILQDLNQYFPEKISQLTVDEQYLFINSCIERAKQYGYDSPKDIYYWSMFTLHQGMSFPDGKNDFYYREVLMEPKRLPENKLNDMIMIFQASQSILNLK